MKKKILLVTLVVCVLAMTIASTTMAYFTDTEKAENIFTTGKVDIQLTQAMVQVEAANAAGTENIVKVDPEVRQTFTSLDYSTIRNIYPGQIVSCDPRIENIGSETAYVAAKITISGVNRTLIAPDATVKNFLQGGELSTTGNLVAYDVSGDDIIVYVIVARSLVKYAGNTNVADYYAVLFQTVNIPTAWGNDEMTECADLEITVDAYATQQVGFADAQTAIQTAFATEFGSITFVTNP